MSEPKNYDAIGRATEIASNTENDLKRLQRKLEDMLHKLHVLSQISFDNKVVLDDSGKLVGLKPSGRVDAYHRAEFPKYPSYDELREVLRRLQDAEREAREARSKLDLLLS